MLNCATRVINSRNAERTMKYCSEGGDFLFTCSEFLIVDVSFSGLATIHFKTDRQTSDVRQTDRRQYHTNSQKIRVSVTQPMYITNLACSLCRPINNRTYIPADSMLVNVPVDIEPTKFTNVNVTTNWSAFIIISASVCNETANNTLHNVNYIGLPHYSCNNCWLTTTRRGR